MTIQWYPGHMTKARRLLVESIPSQDVIIEVLDARMPRASENPVVTELRKQKPCIKVLSKSDLADPDVTRAWLRWFEAERAERSTERPGGKVLAIAISTERPGEAKTKIPALCKQLALHPSGIGKTVRCPWMTSRPNSRGIPRRDCSTAIRCAASLADARTPASRSLPAVAPQARTLDPMPPLRISSRSVMGSRLAL